jgi:hypothetical protein
MLLLGAYSTPELGSSKEAAQKLQYLSNLLSDMSSFLFVYIGGLLILESHERHQVAPMSRRLLQRGGLWLLYAIAIPRAIALPGPVAILFGTSELTIHQASLIFSGAMSLAGYISIALGVFAICEWALSASLCFVVLSLVLYVVGDGARAAEMWMGWKAMSGYLVVLFSVAKLMLTMAFCRIVVKHAMSGGNQITLKP